MQQTVSGTLEVDHRPVDGAEVVLLAPGGRAVEATHSDATGHFVFAAQSVPPGAAVLGKLHAPLVGAAYARVGPAGGPVALAAAASGAAALSVSIELPGGAAPVDWFDVEVTPRALSGVPLEAVNALTLDGTGPARRGNYHTVRVTEPRASLRLLPGSWDLKVSHIIERGKPVRSAPPNWIGGRLTLPGGTQVDAELGSMRVEVTRDVEVRVAMRPFAE